MNATTTVKITKETSVDVLGASGYLPKGDSLGTDSLSLGASMALDRERSVNSEMGGR